MDLTDQLLSNIITDAWSTTGTSPISLGLATSATGWSPTMLSSVGYRQAGTGINYLPLSLATTTPSYLPKSGPLSETEGYKPYTLMSEEE